MKILRNLNDANNRFASGDRIAYRITVEDGLKTIIDIDFTVLNSSNGELEGDLQAVSVYEGGPDVCDVLIDVPDMTGLVDVKVTINEVTRDKKEKLVSQQFDTLYLMPKSWKLKHDVKNGRQS